LLAGDVLYLKADDSTRGELEAAGARPFQPYPDRGGGTMQYYSVPAAILEDRDLLTAWAKTSVAVSRAQHASPAAARRRRVKPKRSPRRTGRPGSSKRS
jgi:DNA transformation protein